MKYLWLLFGALGAFQLYAADSSPSLSVIKVSPSTVDILWPSNFSSWKLTSSTNLNAGGIWSTVTEPPVSAGGMLSILYSVDSGARFFRLAQGECVFQANPTSVAAGEASTLTWCPLPGTTYQLLPEPGTVSGSSFIVHPTVTTIYFLVASNLAGITVSTATVVVSSSTTCDFGSATNWQGTLSFQYNFAVSSSDYNFNINQGAQLAFELVRDQSSPDLVEYSGYVSGTGQLNDSVTELSLQRTTTVVGGGNVVRNTAVANASRLTLVIDCAHKTYSLTVTPWITATFTDVNGVQTGPWAVGGVNIKNRPLPNVLGPLSSAGSLPARGPFWMGGGDFYEPGGLSEGMFTTGTVTDDTAGNATVNWSISPLP